jgi:hypothetical protein
MLRQFRSLPVDHPERGALLRQPEIAAAVAGGLESLLGLVESAHSRRRSDRMIRRDSRLQLLCSPLGGDAFLQR